MKILVIDDEPEIVDLLRVYLSNEGYEIEFTDNSELAWDIFIANPKSFHCIVMDIQMPHLSGFQFYDRLRDQDHHTPIIFMTGHLDQKDLVDQLDLGFINFLSKPFKFSQLKDALMQIEENISD